ncbi:MAG: hypothetical protein K8U03_17820 [Planctomycetia bacterium]|nr:hypothetical protein [Planctomycetia bacterium]
MSCRGLSLSRLVFTSAVAVIAVLGFQAAAQAQSGVYGTIDPYDFVPAAGTVPYVSTVPMFQTQPFAVGYSLSGGYRPIYTGVPQPIGNEIIETHGGNGYVYRPIYAGSMSAMPQYYGSNGYVNRGSPGSALVIDNPGTPYESRYSTPKYWPHRAAVIDVTPNYGAGSRQYLGPGYDDANYGLQTNYATEVPQAKEVPQANGLSQRNVPTLAPGPRPKSVEELPRPRREF